jgi:hypothetical protein
MLTDADLRDAKPSPEPMPKNGSKLSGQMTLPQDFPELRLFALLKWHMGGPNGPFTMLLENPSGDPDAAFKWDYLFVPAGDLKLQIIRAVRGIDIWWWGTEVAPDDIVAYLHDNLARYEKEIEEVIAGLEQYTLIMNPYVRHRAIARFASEDLDKVNPVEPKHPEGLLSREQIAEYIEHCKQYMNLVERQASLLLLLVTESAFMAEAYLNLLIAILVRPQIRATKAIMDECLLRNWRAKIQRLHVDCHGIPEAADLGDARVANAKRMFDIRNRVAHSYPDREAMAVGKMWFDQCFPVLEKAEAFSNLAIVPNNQLPSLEEARFCWKVSNALVEFLTDLVDPRRRDDIRLAAKANPLGYNETKKIYGIPFGPVVIMSVAPGKGPAPEEKP